LPLDEVIKRVNPAGRPRRAIVLWKALAIGHDGDRRRETPRGDGWAGFPIHGTSAQGAAWIVMIVARALDYAHQKETFHRDVKPGNVLLTLDYGPQLLDFNLAESPHSARQAEAAIHGGTLPYMAPEQIEAFLNPDLWDQVGAQADIYSLGLVLRELLTGQAPDLPAQELSPPRALRVLLDRRPLLDVSVRRAHPAIPHALEAIVAKCLAIAPADRYSDASALAEDLDRFLKHRPLAHAVNPSRRERAHNWVVRQRVTLAAVAIGLIVVAILAFQPIITRLKPIERDPSFLAAVNNIELEKFDAGEKGLRDLPSWYRDSALRNLYLVFALDGRKHTVEADPILSAAFAALKARDVRSKLDAWAKDHPKIPSHLRNAAEERVQRAEDFVRGREKDHEPDNWKDLFTLATAAGRLAAELELITASPTAAQLDSQSIGASRRLAIADEAKGNYSSAYQRVSGSINSARSALDHLVNQRASAEKVDKLEGELFASRTVRARIATSWAGQLRSQGGSRALDDALGRMKGAIEDLENSERHAKKVGGAVLSYFALSNKARALLTLGEIEIDLHRFTEAKDHLRQSDRAIEALTPLTKGTALALPPDVPRWNQRVEAGLRRLGVVEVPGEVTSDQAARARGETP
jgi:hypothetical protein